MTPMETIKRHDTGAAVEDVQQRLATIGLLDQAAIDGAFGEQTAAAVRAFCIQAGLPAGEDVTGKVWSALVDASYFLGDRTLYLRMPHFHGHDVAADVLESNALCLFGTHEFTRSVASRMSNLALATSPASKIVSADSLLVKPDQEMLLVHIVLAEEATAEAVPRVSFDDEATLPLRLETAIGVADAAAPSRIAVELPGTMWEDAGEGRSAQHFAITLLDALCSALS